MREHWRVALVAVVVLVVVGVVVAFDGWQGLVFLLPVKARLLLGSP